MREGTGGGKEWEQKSRSRVIEKVGDTQHAYTDNVWSLTSRIRPTLMPNTHRRRRRDSTVELSRVGVASASAVCTHQSSVVTQFPIFCASHRLLRLVASDAIMTSLIKNG